MTTNQDDLVMEHAWGLLNNLRGVVDLTRYTPIILALLVLLYVKKNKDHNRENALHQWDEVSQIFAELWPYNTILSNEFLEQLVENRVELDNRYPNEFVATFNCLNKICDKEISENIFGDLFEYLLLRLTEHQGRSGGEAYTPRDIVQLITEIVAPKQGESVYDLACGSGGFLWSAWDYAQKHSEGNLSCVAGQDIDRINSFVARLNMIVHDIDQHSICQGNSLQSESVSLEHKFDVVMANPPFSLKQKDYSGNLDVFRFGMPPITCADYAFIQHALYHLKPKGRAAIIVAPGVLFRGGAEKDIREKLIEENHIETVITLPTNIFSNTGIAVSILVFKSERKTSDIFFIDASSNFKSTRQGRLIDTDSCKEIVNIYDSRKTEMNYAYLATLDEIRSNDFNLEVSRYVQTKTEECKPLHTLIEKQDALEKELQQLQNKMKHYI